jgi:hypothetical protein
VFAWLRLIDRLNIRNILRRKKHKLQGNDYNCVLCTNHYEETTFHLFFSCHFSRECPSGNQLRFDLDFHSMMEEASVQFHSKFFMDVFIIGAWLIWKQRNDWVFNRPDPPSKDGKLASSRKPIFKQLECVIARRWPSKALCNIIASLPFLFLFIVFSIFIGQLGPECIVLFFQLINKVFCTSGVSLAVFDQKKIVHHLIPLLVIYSSASYHLFFTT